MPGPGGEGPCPSPLKAETCPVTPSYDRVPGLWPCPTTQNHRARSITARAPRVLGATHSARRLTQRSRSSAAAAPRTGVGHFPYFNWIIGACKGSGCGAYLTAPSTQRFKDASTQLVVNYVATYQWSSSQRVWELVKDSSFNTDGSRPPYDVVKPNGGISREKAWLQPQPGGAAAWTWGYYPAGVKGAGPPGMLFVLSVESVWNVAWYMLNQATLDKGPTVARPTLATSAETAGGTTAGRRAMRERLIFWNPRRQLTRGPRTGTADFTQPNLIKWGGLSLETPRPHATRTTDGLTRK